MNGPVFFIPKGISNPYKLFESKKPTRSGLAKMINKVKKEGRVAGYSKHELNDESMFSTAKDKRTTKLIDDALVDAALDQKLSGWQIAAYLDSPEVVKDLDTLAGTILDLEKSGDQFFLNKKADVYDEAYSLFKKAIKEFLDGINDKQKGYLKDLWQEETEHLDEMSDQDIGKMPVFKIIDNIVKKRIKRSDVEKVLEKIKAYSKLDAINQALNSMETDGAVFEKNEPKIEESKKVKRNVLTESDSIKQIGSKTRKLIQYRDGGESFSATSKTTPTLEAGVYDIAVNYDGACIFSKKEIKTDEILRFEDARQDKTIAEIKKFWGLSEKFEQMGFLHKRGILLHGSPGTGKSILTKIIMNDIVESGDVVFVAKSPGAARSCLKEFREVEPNRKVVVVFEDMDEIVYMGEHAILELFDGDDSLDHVLFLGTTNYIDRIPPRILRPGRFDRKIPIGNPPASGRKAYFEKKLKGKVEDSVIDNLVEKTDDFSFAELKELLVSIYCLEEGVDEAIKNLKGKSYNKFSKISESKLDSIIQARPTAKPLFESKKKL